MSEMSAHRQKLVTPSIFSYETEDNIFFYVTNLMIM